MSQYESRNNKIDEDEAQEFLTFSLGSEEYGIDILKVQEIRGYERVTKIANSPEFIKGVINLRGVIVPIVDLRVKFNLPKVDYNEFTVVIILNISNRVVGVVVDGVSDVISFTSGQIKSAPDFSSEILDTSYIIGLGSIAEQMIILVNIDRLMHSDGMALIDAALNQDVNA